MAILVLSFDVQEQSSINAVLTHSITCVQHGWCSCTLSQEASIELCNKIHTCLLQVSYNQVQLVFLDDVSFSSCLRWNGWSVTMQACPDPTAVTSPSLPPQDSHSEARWGWVMERAASPKGVRVGLWLVIAKSIR